MESTIHHPSARVAPVLGFVVGVWLLPSVSTGASETLHPASDAAINPDHIVLAQADAAPDERPVSFSPDQADRGEERYVTDCEECHGDDLKGGLNGGPPLRGVAFEQKYTGDLPALLLFSLMSSEMPPNSPGRYPANTYADLMAYILQRNGFQPGAPLPSDPDALGYVIMEK